MKISACLIVRDGAETLERALLPLKHYVDEIVIGIDSRTTDTTEQIANKYADIVFHYDWIEDFAYARNLVASKATHDNILVIDADDQIEPGKKTILREAYGQGDGIRFTVATSENTSVKSIRGYNRKTAKYVYRVHEYLKFIGGENPVVVDVPITITHKRGSHCIDPGRNIRILEEALSEYPRYLFYYGRECFEHQKYNEAISSFNRYLDVSKWPAEKHEAMIGIARSYIQLGDLDSAKKQSLLILLTDPNFMPAYNLLGQIASVQGDWHTAIQWYENALRVQDTQYVFDDRQSLKFNCYGNMVLAYHRIGDINKARDILILARGIDPTSEWLDNQVKLCEKK